ncbi:MAG: helix-turn-helix domain-containing protein [Paracoccaceae bacterium]
MAKKFPVNRIKTHRIYTVWEISDLLGCHRQTVIRWINDQGLISDTSAKPWLIEGRDLKPFLGVRQTSVRCKLAMHHCFCLGCRGPREPDGKIADYVQQTPDSGRLIALCPECGAVMNKIVRRIDLDAIRAKIEVTVQRANPRLVSRASPLLNVSFVQEANTHGKAQQR